MSISTSKILGKLGRSVSVTDNDLQAPDEAAFDAPQLIPSAKCGYEMKDILNKALGQSFSQKHSPMD